MLDAVKTTPIIPKGKTSLDVLADRPEEVTEQQKKVLADKAWSFISSGVDMPTELSEVIDNLGIDINLYPQSDEASLYRAPKGWIANSAGEWARVGPYISKKAVEETQEETKGHTSIMSLGPGGSMSTSPPTEQTPYDIPRQCSNTPQPDKLTTYLEGNKTIKYLFNEGTFTSAVCDAIVSDNGICVISNVNTPGAFVPRIGARFRLEVEGTVYDCFYPPTLTVVDRLGIRLLFFGFDDGAVHQEEREPQAAQESQTAQVDAKTPVVMEKQAEGVEDAIPLLEVEEEVVPEMREPMVTTLEGSPLGGMVEVTQYCNVFPERLGRREAQAVEEYNMAVGNFLRSLIV